MKMTEELIGTMREFVQSWFNVNGDYFTAQELATIATQMRVSETPQTDDEQMLLDVQRQLDSAEWLVSEADIIDERPSSDDFFTESDQAWFSRPIRWAVG